MPRPRSDEKRSAILEAATRMIVMQGMGGPTAGIAKEAGVANGSLFTYFETKTDLFNELYLELKAEMASATLKRVPVTGEVRGQFSHAWRNWMNWALAHPEKRKALAQLGVSDEIKAETRERGHKTMAPVAALLELARAKGPLKKASKGFVVALMTSVAEATMDCMNEDPAHAARYSREGFEALWRMLN